MSFIGSDPVPAPELASFAAPARARTTTASRKGRSNVERVGGPDLEAAATAWLAEREAAAAGAPDQGDTWQANVNHALYNTGNDEPTDGPVQIAVVGELDAIPPGERAPNVEIDPRDWDRQAQRRKIERELSIGERLGIISPTSATIACRWHEGHRELPDGGPAYAPRPMSGIISSRGSGGGVGPDTADASMVDLMDRRRAEAERDVREAQAPANGPAWLTTDILVEWLRGRVTANQLAARPGTPSAPTIRKHLRDAVERMISAPAALPQQVAVEPVDVRAAAAALHRRDAMRAAKERNQPQRTVWPSREEREAAKAGGYRSVLLSVPNKIEMTPAPTTDSRGDHTPEDKQRILDAAAEVKHHGVDEYDQRLLDAAADIAMVRAQDEEQSSLENVHDDRRKWLPEDMEVGAKPAPGKRWRRARRGGKPRREANRVRVARQHALRTAAANAFITAWRKDQRKRRAWAPSAWWNEPPKRKMTLAEREKLEMFGEMPDMSFETAPDQQLYREEFTDSPQDNMELSTYLPGADHCQSFSASDVQHNSPALKGASL